MNKDPLETGRLNIKDLVKPGREEVVIAVGINMEARSSKSFYNGYIVDCHPDGFQGWVDFDENDPMWQMVDGRYIPLNIMQDDHLVACHKLVEENLRTIYNCYEGTKENKNKAVFELIKWEKVLFNEANNRGLVTKLYD